jgi:hypothetical protein
MRLIQLPTELLLLPATGEGWDGGDANMIDAISKAGNPPSQPSPIFMGEGDVASHHGTSIGIGSIQKKHYQADYFDPGKSDVTSSPQMLSRA